MDRMNSGEIKISHRADDGSSGGTVGRSRSRSEYCSGSLLSGRLRRIKTKLLAFARVRELREWHEWNGSMSK
jgi:hypothetical protein